LPAEQAAWVLNRQANVRPKPSTSYGVQTSIMKVRIFSWILAGAYLVCGVILFLFTSKIQDIYSGYNIQVPFLTRAMFSVGPYGCFFLAVAVGAALVLNDLRFQKRFVSLFFAITLLLWACYMADTLFNDFTYHIT
jgi:hypothetical protein